MTTPERQHSKWTMAKHEEKERPAPSGPHGPCPRGHVKSVAIRRAVDNDTDSALGSCAVLQETFIIGLAARLAVNVNDCKHAVIFRQRGYEKDMIRKYLPCHWFKIVYSDPQASIVPCTLLLFEFTPK